ncbi:MAG: hypothetical protein JO359_12375, partial [Candidatus Eremiobacteraeota bacterium]|nr:hypothetical protein [Candidatus Eremiobacteraeota bacterium]
MSSRHFAAAGLWIVLTLGPLAALAQPSDQPPPPGPALERGDRWSASHVAGVISTIQGSSLQLDNGRVVFMHRGTVINPTGTKLVPGMWIAVLGSPSSR